MDRSKILKGLFYSFISACAFASLAIFVRIGYDIGFSTKEMLFYRFLSASVFMAIFLLIKDKKTIKPTKNLIKKTIITGDILYTAQAFCFFSSVKYVSPSVTELLLYLYPAFVSLLAVFIFNESINMFKVSYILAILVGFVFIFNDALNSKLKLMGVVFGISAMVIYSIYLIVAQRFLNNENPLSFTFYTIVFAAISFAIIFHPNLKPISLKQLLIVISLGLISTVVAIGFLFASIEIIGSSLTSIFSSFEPVITIILSTFVLNMTMNIYQIIGAFFILLGVFMANLYHLRVSKT